MQQMPNPMQLPNPMANMYQSQLEASRRFAEAIFTGTERLDKVVIEATHQAFNDQLSFVQALTAGGDLGDAGAALQTSLLKRNAGEAVNYQAEIIRIVTDIQNEIGESMQDYIEQMGAQAANAPSKAAQTAKAQQRQAGDAIANPMASMTNMASMMNPMASMTNPMASMTNPMTSMLSVWESAFKEVTALAAKNMSMARSTTERTVDTASNLARTTARTAESATEKAAHSMRRMTEDANDHRKGGKSR
jgi:phasin family protein